MSPAPSPRRARSRARPRPVSLPRESVTVEETRSTGRIRFLAVVFALGYMVLGMRAVDLAVIQGDTLRERARNQHTKKVKIPAYRGRFVDRNGQTLAISLPVKTLSIDIDRMGDPVALSR
ncbi:MAG: hypothetical protein H7831_19160, partial [Magnetococcus sp. WYHC-3]